MSGTFLLTAEREDGSSVTMALPYTVYVPSLEDFNVLPVKTIFIFLAVLLLPGIAAAEEVYKAKNKQGVVEYSDEPFAGAKEVDIKPNVTHFEQAKPTESAAPATGEAPSTTTENVETSGGVVVDAEGREAAAVEAERRRAAAVEAERRKEVVDPRGPGGVHAPAGRGRR